MNNQPLVLVVTVENDPQLALLKNVPHVAGASLDAFGTALPYAGAILYWSGSRDTLREIFLACPRVRWVHSRNAGLDNTLFSELVESTVPVTNGSGVFSQSLGEFALTAILYFAKDLPRMLRNQAAHRWEQFDVDEISGQTVGIVGYGDIGRAVAWRTHAMGMKVLALKRHAPAEPDPIVDRFFAPQQIFEMLSLCDYIVVAAPLTQETRHLLSDSQFSAMKPTAIVINVGRGPVIDQEALFRALVGKKIRGAGLDVFEKEPIPEVDPIWSLDNVLISPHTADHTATWLNQAMQFFIDQYQRFSNGQPLKNVVDKRLGY